MASGRLNDASVTIPKLPQTLCPIGDVIHLTTSHDLFGYTTLCNYGHLLDTQAVRIYASEARRPLNAFVNRSYQRL